MTYKESYYNIEIKKNNDKILVYNTNSTALCWFTKDFYKLFHNKKSIDASYIPIELINNGFVVPEYKNEISDIDMQRQKYIFNMYPEKIRYIIAPTLSCNMHCKYCFENGVSNKTSLSKEDCNCLIQFIKKQVEENDKLKVLEIVWFGGEPTIAFEKIKMISKSIIEYCNSKKVLYKSTIVTNASLLDYDMIKSAKEECRIDSMQTTIDGVESDYIDIRGVDKSVYNKVLENVKLASKMLDVTIRVNVTNEGKENIKKFLDYLFNNKEYDNIKIYFSMVRDYSCNECYNTVNKDEFINIRKNLENYMISKGLSKQIKNTIEDRRIVSCSSIQIKSAAIGPDLKLYRCQHCFGNNDYVIGDCINGFYNNMIDNKFLNYQISSKCKKCKYYPICANGCREELIIQNRHVDCEELKNRLIEKIAIYNLS